jgi:hypothetical protein
MIRLTPELRDELLQQRDAADRRREACAKDRDGDLRSANLKASEMHRLDVVISGLDELLRLAPDQLHHCKGCGLTWDRPPTVDMCAHRQNPPPECRVFWPREVG